ncbi:hypothetical protein GGF32_004273, partial [Allomyces javanicus]
MSTRSSDSDDYDLIQVDDAASSTAGSPPPTPPSPPARGLFAVDDTGVPVCDSDGSRADACGALGDTTCVTAMDPVECAMGMNTNNDQAVQERDGGADAGPDATPSLDSAHRDPTDAAVDEITTTAARDSTIIADTSDLAL